jgi:DNA invertase Pin-like site-specific DNA recombinase
VRYTIPRGDRHYAVKQTIAQIMEIKSASGSQQEIARRYGISQPTVSAIKGGKHWATKLPQQVRLGETEPAASGEQL